MSVDYIVFGQSLVKLDIVVLSVYDENQYQNIDICFLYYIYLWTYFKTGM